MADANPDDSPLETAAGAAGPHTTQAFKLLSNETRLAILIALWEAYEPLEEDIAVPFSALRDRVGMRDSGQFNYHLEKLTGHFIQSSEEGYELREAGFKLVRAVIAGTGIEETTLSPTGIDMSCGRCGETPIEISYQEEAVYLKCRACEGFVSTDAFPSGLIGYYYFDPAGLARRDPAEILVGSLIKERNQLRMLQAGICPDCSGTIDSSLRLCEDHAPGPKSVCPNCGTRDSARVRYICTVCKHWNEHPVESALMGHPAMIAFYYDHDIDLRHAVNDFEGFQRLWNLFWERDHTIVSLEPVRIRVTIPCEGDELRLLLDEELSVIKVSSQT